jgi:bifunctional DNase/RNase
MGIRNMEIEVKIRALMMDPNSGTPIIILKDVNSETMLPIWVGAYEANAIALEIEKIAPPRPMTHDLLRNLIVELGLTVDRVVVTSLRDNTFYAVIEMTGENGDAMRLDSRPSDAIALALRADCPIFVDQEVIQASRNSVATDESGESEGDIGEEEWPDVIGDASDLPM